MIIEYKESARNDMNIILDYIVDRGYPITGIRFMTRMISFINGLYTFPNIHSLCRFKRFMRRNLRCAIFEDNYIIAYKTFKRKIVIHAVINTKRLKS